MSIRSFCARFSVVAAISSILSPICAATQNYELRLIALLDAEHRGPDGVFTATWNVFAPAGEIGGGSSRFDITGNNLGQTAFVYDARTNQYIRLGLTGAAHTSSNTSPTWPLAGYRFSTISRVTTAFAAGMSMRFDTPSPSYDLWLHDRTTGITRTIGPRTGDYQAGDGSTYGSIRLLDQHGRVAGQATHYVGNASAGNDAFWYDAIADQLRTISLDDPAHVSAIRGRQSKPEMFLADGRLVGTSERFVGLLGGGDVFETSQTPWLYDPASNQVQQLHPAGSEFVRSNGYRNTEVRVAESGYAVLTARRFRGMESTGSSVFLADLNTGQQTEIALLDSLHIAANGDRSVQGVRINTRGQVLAEQSRRGDLNGNSVVYYDPRDGSTRRIGLIDAAHTGPDGGQVSSRDRLADSGFATGTSWVGRTSLGGSHAWVYNPDTQQTTRLGLLDAVHQRGDGYNNSLPIAVNDSGQVVGTSKRYVNGAEAGKSGWFFDSASGVTTPLVFSVSTGGVANTEPHALSVNGWVAGRYRKYDGVTDLGWHAFLWNQTEGLLDLNTASLNGFDPTIWSEVTSVFGPDPAGYVFGYGTLVNGGSAAFVFAPVVPEPHAASVSLALSLIAMRRGRMIC